MAEEFLDWINEYTKYCVPEKVESWKQITRDIVYSPLVLKPGIDCTPEIQELIDNRECSIIDDLFNFIDAGAIMKMYNDTKSWDEVRKLISEQGHSGYTFSGMCNVMLQFSPYGAEFVDTFSACRLKYDEDFRKKYIEANELQKERNNLNHRLVIALSKKLK